MSRLAAVVRGKNQLAIASVYSCRCSCCNRSAAAAPVLKQTKYGAIHTFPILINLPYPKLSLLIRNVYGRVEISDKLIHIQETKSSVQRTVYIVNRVHYILNTFPILYSGSGIFAKSLVTARRIVPRNAQILKHLRVYDGIHHLHISIGIGELITIRPARKIR